MANPYTASRPPTGSFNVWQRIFRGYGPLAVLAAFVLVVALLVPSKPQTTVNSGAGGYDSNAYGAPSTTVAAGGGQGAASSGGSAGTPGSGGSQGSAGTTATGAGGQGAVQVPARTTACPGAQVTNDPYAPPCITFSGSNGGATAKGVTGTDINVAFRVLNEKGFQQTLAQLAGASLTDTPDTVTKTVTALADYFNTHFQLYGRKIKIKTYNGTGSLVNELVGQGQEQANSDATNVADQIGAFADISAGSEPYADGLASRHVMAFGDPYLSAPWHLQRRPYAWSLATDCSELSEEVGNYGISRLQGTADYAGGTDSGGKPLKGQPRRIAGLAPDNSWYQECIGAFVNKAKGGGLNIVDSPQYKLSLPALSNQAASLIPKLRSEGVTTIVCGCDPIMPVFLSGEANREGYYPEFINIGVALDDTDVVGQLWNSNFAAHSFGISSLTDDPSAQVTSSIPSSSIAYKAYKTVRPQDEPAFSVQLIYAQMYMLAIGIQMAGPNLNPASFEQGMFHYPSHLGPFGLWQFGPGHYTPAADVREIYWSPNTISPANGKRGAWVDPKPGVRYPNGMAPKGPPPFAPPP
jgi:hypothetical protein